MIEQDTAHRSQIRATDRHLITRCNVGARLSTVAKLSWKLNGRWVRVGWPLIGFQFEFIVTAMV